MRSGQSLLELFTEDHELTIATFVCWRSIIRLGHPQASRTGKKDLDLAIVDSGADDCRHPRLGRPNGFGS